MSKENKELILSIIALVGFIVVMYFFWIILG